MSPIAQGIPGLPDLTHPDELIKFGTQLLQGSLLFVFLIVALGVAIALISFSLRRNTSEQAVFFGEWSIRYSQLLKGLQHLALILILVVTGFFLTSTLSNRYHHWEQAKVAQVAESVAGDKLEQIAPQVRYIVEEPYSYTTQVNGKIVKVTDKQKVTRYLNLAGSNIQVKIDQSVNVQNRSAIYNTDYNADYKIVNSLSDVNSFFFEALPPYGYSLLSSYKVERDGTRLKQINPGDYGFPFQLEPGQETTIKVSYQAQGGPRWVYNATNQLLSQFRLTTIANFRNADFASGIVPQEIKNDGDSTQFTWIFDDNVSVRNPFGVFTATKPIGKTGIIPRLLLLAPGLFLWWILLLYLSLPMSLKNVTIAAGIFFACLLTLTYLGRVMNAEIAWLIISLILLGFIYGLGANRHAALAAIICTIAGAILPVFALLIPLSGLTLSLAGLLSVGWLAVHHWYGQLIIDN
ncbi:UbiA family prenyltransferase [Sphaerospermopsis torques-reginae]|uniref:UbiA family prenyltransferase n=1 Tax=Sphaerospermopsis torques-reginae ITEP-024 TaxID=984208 RepID=A0ABX8X270_9CYAN|nr:UbiA family prenyltransferase [Sphaerospermopsis torques-reginae]QYX32779.1 UbiA family prenyltransferase [Sphaerospermopsis torques-reginae ITEP-024]